MRDTNIGPVVSCEKTVKGNPPYMTTTKNPNASSVAGAYPAMNNSAIVSNPVKTLPKTCGFKKKNACELFHEKSIHSDTWFR